MIRKELLDILACPQCKGHVESNQDESELLCRSCRLAYAIRDGIPIMLIDEARRLDAAETGQSTQTTTGQVG
jgi:uncharacterized protein YbaR (Trm112 family)